MNETIKAKRPIQADYMTDFVTALPLTDCIERLERQVVLRDQSLRHPLARMTQRVQVQENHVFRIERRYAGGLYPIRLMGRLDPDPDGGRGTWVQAAITHDPRNQVMIEGMVVFFAFFFLTVMLFFRLRVAALVVSVPVLIALLWLFGMRWRALNDATEDLVRWVRRRLYVTSEQVR